MDKKKKGGKKERKAINFPCLVVWKHFLKDVFFTRYFCGVAKIRSKIVKKKTYYREYSKSNGVLSSAKIPLKYIRPTIKI